MDQKEKKELIDKIMNVDGDAAGSRVAVTVFLNKSSREDAHYFMDYIDHPSPAVKKAARFILGQKGVTEALPGLVDLFMTTVDSLTFMPDVEYKDTQYYANLIEILEAVFAILREECVRDDEFLDRIDEIFKKTRNEDLRFTLIKLIGLLGDRFEYFLQIYNDLTEKERRALYYIYTFVEEPRRIEIYKLGLNDEPNFEYVVSNMLNFAEGRGALGQELPSLGSYKKQTVLKKLQDSEERFPEFNDVLIKLLNDDNKFLVGLAIDNLKHNAPEEMPLDPFLQLLETGYSSESINGALEVIAHFCKENPEDVYLDGLERQPFPRNKNIILEFLIKQIKGGLKPTAALTEKVLAKISTFFENYTKEKEDLFMSIFKIIPMLIFKDVEQLKAVMTRVIDFQLRLEKRLSIPLKTSLGELVKQMSQMLDRFEESEARMQRINSVFELDAEDVDQDRLQALKKHLQEMGDLDNDTHGRLIRFLCDVHGASKRDWKLKALVSEMLENFGGQAELLELDEGEAQEKGEATEEVVVRPGEETEWEKEKASRERAASKKKAKGRGESVLILEPLAYVQIKLNRFFKAQDFKVFNLKQLDKFSDIISRPFKFLVVSDALLSDEFMQQIFDYMDANIDTVTIILSADPDSLDLLQGIPNVRFVRRPFDEEELEKIIG